MTKIELIGIKPTIIHLGHILSVFEYVKLNPNVCFLVADYHKFSSSKTYKEVIHLKNYLCNFLKQNNIKYVCQSEFASIYGDLFFYFSGKIKTSSLNKIFNINYGNTENNLMKLIYPLLMLIDIFLFQPCTVIVSKDQIHNVRYIKTQLKNIIPFCFDIDFKILDIKILNPYDLSKMGTSESSNKIFLNDTYDSIFNIIKKVQSSTNFPLCYEDLNENIQHLYFILSIIKKESVKILFNKIKFDNYLLFKKYVTQSIYDFLQIYQNKNLCVTKQRQNIQDIKKIIFFNYKKIKNTY